jgi:ribonuclease P protein component
MVTAVRGEEGGVRVGLVANLGRGRAVARNRVRRRLREALRAAEAEGGYDIVVRGGPETAEVEFQQLVSHMRDALIEAGVRCR